MTKNSNLKIGDRVNISANNFPGGMVNARIMDIIYRDDDSIRSVRLIFDDQSKEPDHLPRLFGCSGHYYVDAYKIVKNQKSILC